MENLGAVPSSQRVVVLGCAIPPRYVVFNKPVFSFFAISRRTGRNALSSSAASVMSLPRAPSSRRIYKSTLSEKFGRDGIASITSSSEQETSTIAVSPQPPVPPEPSYVGSPLFWIGVGVGFSALFSWVASYLKKYAMQQAFKTLMGQMDSQNNQFGNSAYPFGSSFPFPIPSGPVQATSPSAPASQRVVTVDVPATKVEALPTEPLPTAACVENEVELEKEPKKSAFVDVSPDDTLNTSPFGGSQDPTEVDSSKDPQFTNQASQNGAASTLKDGDFKGSSTTQKANPILSVDALEKMMEDPTVQKMVYPYLPEEMRNPASFKWMLQNPQYRQQLQDMLNNMGGSAEWDNQMMDSLKNFDISSPEVKQQFDQIGLTPEEVISKIMANPDVAMAFQNPRVQAAIMDCSQNPYSIAKYQNDKEVMDVFNKISALFPGVGSP